MEILQTRSFAAVLFRRIATKNTKNPRSGETKECFSNLTVEQRVAIRDKLVGCLSSETLPDVRNKIGDAIAEIARQYTDNGMSWLPDCGSSRSGNSACLACFIDQKICG